ncbi:hypothetical protein GCM10023319_06080 [Nocardia iowensis]
MTGTLKSLAVALTEAPTRLLTSVLIPFFGSPTTTRRTRGSLTLARTMLRRLPRSFRPADRVISHNSSRIRMSGAIASGCFTVAAFSPAAADNPPPYAGLLSIDMDAPAHPLPQRSAYTNGMSQPPGVAWWVSLIIDSGINPPDRPLPEAAASVE